MYVPYMKERINKGKVTVRRQRFRKRNKRPLSYY